MRTLDNSIYSSNAVPCGGAEGSFFFTISSKNATCCFNICNCVQGISNNSVSFTFTGKEKDEETGYGYFGARYMDHELMTMWLSVDPMADKYPNISPYAYCAWNPVKLVDPDGKDPIYGMIWFNLRKIGDDGQTNGKAYFVTGGKKISVLFSHIRGRTYSGSLMPSENVFSVPTGEIAKDVQATIEMVKQSGDSPDSQVEFGAHAIRGARNAIIWDPGEPMRSEENGTRRWSITPFVKNGKPTRGNPADVEFVWHVQPTSSKPSAITRIYHCPICFFTRSKHHPYDSREGAHHRAPFSFF